jgi:hypothetical protein
LPPLSLAPSIVFCELPSLFFLLPPFFFLIQPLLYLQKETFVVWGAVACHQVLERGSFVTTTAKGGQAISKGVS